MLVIIYYFEFNSKMPHNGITDCIQSTISLSMINLVNSVSLDGEFALDAILLLEMALCEFNRSFDIYVLLLEYVINLIRLKLSMLMVRYTLNSISNIFLHLLWKVEAILCLKDESNTALTGL